MGTSEAVYRYTAVQTFGFGKTIGTTFLRWHSYYISNKSKLGINASN